MDKILKLDNLCKSLISEGGIFGKNGFFDKNKYIILISFLAGIFANLTDITTPTYGFDTIDSISEDYFKTFFYVNMRIVVAFFYRLIPSLSLHGISELVGIFILSISASIIVDRINISNVAKVIFSILFVANPIWSHLIYFYHQFAYNAIGVLFSVISFAIIFNAIAGGKKHIIYILLSIFFLLLAVFSYQSILLFFITLGTFYALFYYVEKLDFKYSFKFLLTVIFISILTFFIYIIIIKLMFGEMNSYQQGLFRNLSNFKQIKNSIGAGITDVYRLMISHRQYTGMGGLSATFFLFLFLIVNFVKLRNIKNILIFMLFFLAFFLSCFIFKIFISTGVWSNIYFPLYVAGSIILGYLTFKRFIWKAFVLICSIFVFFTVIQYISLNQQAQIIVSETDKIIMQRITDIVYDKAPELYDGEKAIIFIGSISTENRHPIIKQSAFQYQFSQINYLWIGLFLKLYGLPNNLEVVTNVGFVWHGLYNYYIEDKAKNLDSRYLKAKEIAKSMPSYPDRDCVKVEDDYVIVKLGDVK